MGLLSNYKNKLSTDERYALQMVRFFFWDINWIKTIWFNFKAFPFKQAVKLPFIISYNTKVKNIGKIILSDQVHTGMVSVGVIKLIGFEANDVQTVFNNRGTFSVAGNMKIHPGVKLVIGEGAKLIAAHRNILGGNTKVICHKQITMEDEFRISWNSQILDTDFHFLHNLVTDKYYPRRKAVHLGKGVWAGNSCTIGKGTIIPDGSVISCVSKVSGDFTEYGKNLLISGNPAKVLKVGFEMGSSWHMEREEAMSKTMGE